MTRLFFKWVKKTYLMLLSYLKKSPLFKFWPDVIYPSMSSIHPFIMAVSTLVEYRRSLIIRPDLFCDRKYLVAPTFKTSVQRVFKGFLWFFQLSYKTFYVSPSQMKNVQVFKNWIHFLLIHSVLLKINMDKTPQKVTKDKEPKRQYEKAEKNTWISWKKVS